METSSYMHMSNKKPFYLSRRIMEKQYSSDSNISTDSLERSRHKPSTANQENSDENVDTILVPFYENDVLIKVPKIQKKGKKNDTKTDKSDKRKKEVVPNYLVNKNKKKGNSYLEMFRMQFSSPSRELEQPKDENDISSLQPEFGDTERESIGDDASNPVEEFYNTESYNEIFYEKLLNHDLVDSLDNSIDQGLDLNDDDNNVSKTHDEDVEDNLRSVSEVTQHHRRHSRYRTVEPIPNVKLGGLGPDMERIKPRLDRARSLQRYSEKVRMENRLRIYKKSVEAEKRTSREPSTTRHGSAKGSKDAAEAQNHSYLVKTSEEQKLNFIRKVYESKCKSANAKSREETKGKDKKTSKQTEDAIETKKSEIENVNEKNRQKVRPKRSFDKNGDKELKVKETRIRVKSSARSRGMNTEGSSNDIPPVQISFLVNVGGVRPSSALKTLEEKHRMYQEQVKAFTLDDN